MNGQGLKSLATGFVLTALLATTGVCAAGSFRHEFESTKKLLP
jgi:hypothetical protein